MQIIIFLLSNLLGTLLYFLLICRFLSFKLTPKQKLGLLFLLFINILLMNLYLGHIGVVFLLLSCCLYISILHKNRLLNICLFIGSYLFGVVCDNIFSLIWNAFIIPIPKLMSSDYYYILYLLSFDLLMTLICPFAARLVHRFISKIHARLPKQSLLLIVGNLLICLFIFLFNITLGESIGYTQKIITFNCILFGCYFLISTMLIIKIIQSQMDMLAMDMRQETYDRLQEYTNQIEAMYSSLRSFKHDYSNIMLSMSGYIESGDMDGLRAYFNNKIIPANKTLSKNTAHLNYLMNLKITELKSVISAKLLYAIEQGISVTVEITEEISEFPIDTMELSRVLGIFLDNATEAALETQNPSIQFAVIVSDTEYLLIISNTFTNHGLPISTLRQPTVSSKGINRGIGLYNAQEILSKYKHVFWDTETSETHFTQRLRILRK